ncbi:hypothetical protein PV327_006140 [Microctonus hyperodae]|uniref:ABC transporter domain-containing protein n=1 Tax=Microctonus hyperodae TaxID=165561 RepID=A0AA39G354_MICHY|nr:hypothetical protein PV327_006140 [Microctonus hyperodae]
MCDGDNMAIIWPYMASLGLKKQSSNKDAKNSTLYLTVLTSSYYFLFEHRCHLNVNIIHQMDTVNKWCLKNPWVIYVWAKWKTLLWKAIIMRKHTILISTLEILIPILFSLQIRLMFEPLALNLKQPDRYMRSDILASVPRETECHYTPKSEFSDKLITMASSLLNTKISPAVSEDELVMNFYAKNQSHSLKKAIWIIFESGKESQPKVLNYIIRSQQTENTPHGPDPYYESGFIAIQTAIEYSFIQLWKSKELAFTGENFAIGRFPHYQIDLLIMPSAVRPNVSFIYYMTVVAFLLIPMAALHKAIQEKKTGFKALMRISRITPTFIYLGWINYLLITIIPSSIICGIILNPIYTSPDTILCIFLIMYVIMSAFFIFAIGTFFSHSIKAILTSSLLWLSLAHISLVLDESLISATLSIKMIALILPHSGLIYGLAAFTTKDDIEDLMNYESRRIFHETDKQKKIHESNEVAIEYIFFAWSIHIFVWSLIAVYLENIYPGEFGTKKPWYYPCKKKTKVPDDIYITVRGTTNWSAVERPPKFVKPKVRVKKITMDFGFTERREVLKEMSIDFYPNEFSIILGHNGAGKSTLLKIISGMYHATYGHVYIEGRDYSDDSALEELRYKSIIGYCPQENMLLDYFTIFEHLYLFGMMKGMSFIDARLESNRLLKLFKLEIQKNICIEKLSFGARRRLCFAMALIGPSDILILDEPTYGVDPQHKKELWQILASVRKQKTVIMATNVMEVADTLADRIAIIANNRIECYGSKSYINRRYGIGYELSMVTKPGCDIKNLQELIQEYSPMPVNLRGKMGTILRFNVAKNTRFPILLSILEAYKDKLKIHSITLDSAGIEGQFRRIGLISQFRERGIAFSHDNYEWIVQKRRRDLIQERIKWNRLSGNALWRQQIGAIVYKKIMHLKASWNPYLFSIIFAIITLVLTVTVSSLSKYSYIHSPETELSVGHYAGRNLFILIYVADDSESQNYFTALKLSTVLLGENNFHQTNNVTTFSIIGHPELRAIEVNINTGPVSLNLFHNTLLKYLTDQEGLEIKLKSRPIVDPHEWQYQIVREKKVRIWENSGIITTLFLLLPIIDLGVQEAKGLAKYLQFNAEGISIFIFWIPVYCIDFIIYFFSVFLITTGTFAAFSNTIKLTPKNIGTMTLQIVARAILIICCYGGAAISMGYCIQLWAHRSGTVYSTIVLINLIAILVINPETIFPLIIYHVSDSIRTNLEIISHIFPPYTFACAIGNFIGISVYNMECSVRNNCNKTTAIEDPCCRNCGNEFCYRPLNVMTESRAKLLFPHSIADDILIMIAQTCFFHIILILFEIKNRRKWRSSNLQKDIIIPTDVDVIAEKNFIDKLIKDYQNNVPLPSEIVVIVKGLSKKYGKKEILREVNLRINKQECFGLLGMNGAGKTTIFRALTGEIKANSGKAIIHGVDMSTNDDKYFGLIGYCPQDDGLIDFLTSRQSLSLFAAIRGIPYENIRDEVDRWLDVFDLLEFENLKLKECSWGVRRKIGVLISLIGDLPVIFLDEPSSGMDIIARGALTETLYQVREMGASIFFTTHNIDETEALCNTIGILIDGRLISIGSCEQLVIKHDNKRIITIILSGQTSVETGEAIQSSMTMVMPYVKFLERFLDILFFRLDDEISFSHVYEKLEDIKRKHSAITDYFVNRQSLEQVYQQLTRREPIVYYKNLTRWRQFLQRISQLAQYFEDL